MRLKELEKDFVRCRLTPVMNKVAFVDWKTLPTKNGLYALWQADLCIYVGQGSGRSGIRGRMKHHWNKAFTVFKSGSGKPNGTKDTAAWAAGRKHPKWKPRTWIVEYVECSSAVSRTYLEGVMLLQFDPLCNDESFGDRSTAKT